MIAYARHVLIVALLGVAISRCSAADKDVKVIQLWGVPDIQLFAGFSKALQEYDEAHPEIRIERGPPTNGQQSLDPQKLMTTFAAGNPPDIVLMDRFELPSWAVRGVFRPLDDLYARDKVDRKDIYEACLAECIYQDGIYGLPWYTDSRALHCNMAVLERHGYTQPPRDWDELKEMTAKLTERRPGGGFNVVGFAPMFGNAWLYMYGWLNGGEFASPDGKRITLADPRIVEALTWMKSCYEPLGGAPAVQDFASSSQGEGAADLFMSNRIGMQIIENGVLYNMARFRPDMKLVVVAPPAPKGKKSVSWSGGFCWSIPNGAKYVDEAWELAKFLNSRECWIRAGEYQLAAERERAKMEGRENAYFVPLLSCSRSLNAELMSRFIPSLPENVGNAYRVHADLLNITRFRPVLPVGKQLWDEQARTANQVLFDNADPATALAAGQARVQAQLDRFYAPKTDPVYPLGKTVTWTVGLVVLAGVMLWGGAAARWRWSRRTRTEALAGVAFASPWLIGFVVLMLGPMLASLIMSMSEYDVVNPARWVGLSNYRNLMGFTRDDAGSLVARDPLFWKAFWNTGFVTLMGVPLGIIISLGMALLVNAEIRGIRIYRTLLYLPVIVPTVATAILWIWLLNNETGITGVALGPIFRTFGMEPISFFGDPRYTAWGVILMSLWASGGSMIIWLAGLKGIPRTYYEAASIDGAGTMRQFFHITLPMLSPYLFFNLVMGVIAWLQVFTQAYVLIVPPGFGPGDSLLYYVIYLFTHGFQYLNMGFACAMAWILFAVVALLTLFQFKIAKRWVHYDV